MAEPLATVADVYVRLGQTPASYQPERIDALLRDASAAARRAAGGQQFTAGTSTVRLTPSFASRQLADAFTWERNMTGLWAVRLPQLPVTDVASVENLDGDDVDFDWPGQNFVYTFTPFLVDVTFDHGYDTIPEDVVAVVCQAVLRSLGNPTEDAGLSQETIGGYSYSRGNVGESGPITLLEYERELLRGYAQPAQPIRML